MEILHRKILERLRDSGDVKYNELCKSFDVPISRHANELLESKYIKSSYGGNIVHIATISVTSIGLQALSEYDSNSRVQDQEQRIRDLTEESLSHEEKIKAQEDVIRDLNEENLRLEIQLKIPNLIQAYWQALVAIMAAGAALGAVAVKLILLI